MVICSNADYMKIVIHQGLADFFFFHRWNYPDLVRLLLYYNSPVTARNKMQLTPLQYARVRDLS